MKLIIEADDFGLSKSISDGIIDGIKHGFITSTNIMANMPCAKYAVEQALKNNIKKLGIHINFTVGKPIIENPLLTDENGVFLYNKKQIENNKLTYKSVYNEIIAQLDMVEKYSRGGIVINHITCHHHLGDNNIIKQVVYDVAKQFSLPIRREDYTEKFDIKKPDLFFCDFSIKNVNLDFLKEFINKYRDTDLVIELLTHAGYIDDYTKTITSYLKRDEELSILRRAKEEGLFDGIELIDYDSF